MMVLPFSDTETTYRLFIVLEDDNLSRMKEYDPAQFNMPVPGFEEKRLTMVIVGYANAADRQWIMQLIQDEKPREALRYLSRGWQFRPDLGDYDGPPLSLRDKGEQKQ
jgi:hypothetical protein